VSDGSFKNSNGTSAFLLCSEEVENCIIGVNVVPGSITEQSAYRSKLAEVSSILLALTILCKKFDIKADSVEIVLDGQQALEAAGGTWPLKVHQPDFNLLRNIRAKIKKLPVNITWHWIRGHQDDRKDYHNLDSRAKHNIQADSLAKAFWNHCKWNNKQLPNQVFGDDGWTFQFNEKKRSKLKKDELHAELFGNETRDYWISKGQIPVAEIHSIDWKNTEAAMKRLSFSR
jgi:ribonuclease HI